MKKVLSCVIVLVMIFSMNGAAYAADRDDAIPYDDGGDNGYLWRRCRS